ncbi:hypothetical protein D3C81_1108570 [compost metagenome]
MVESISRYSEIGRKNILWGMCEPIRNGKCIEVREMAVIKDEQKLAAILQTLYGMGNTRWKIPQITGTNVGNKVMSVLIDCCYSGMTEQHIRPLCLLMPMQLANTAGCQAHINARKRGCDRQLAHRDFPGPSSLIQLHMGIGEGEPQIRNKPGIGNRRNQHIRILLVSHNISRALINRPCSVASNRLRSCSPLLDKNQMRNDMMVELGICVGCVRGLCLFSC